MKNDFKLKILLCLKELLGLEELMQFKLISVFHATALQN